MAEDRPPEIVLLRAGDAIASIDPERGGRLLSLEVDGFELLEPPRPYAGAVPTYGSFLLAPWVGELFEGRLRFADREYRLPQNVGRHATHGLVFDGPWEVEFQSGSELRIRRELGPPWPFGGVVRQQFVLEADGLRQTAEVESADSAMPVA